VEATLQVLAVQAPPLALQVRGHHLHDHHVVGLHLAPLVLPEPRGGGAQVGRGAAEALGELGADALQVGAGEGVPLGTVDGEEELDQVHGGPRG
jgi:hypothetical protein